MAVMYASHSYNFKTQAAATERASKDTNAIDNGVDNTECKTF